MRAAFVLHVESQHPNNYRRVREQQIKRQRDTQNQQQVSSNQYATQQTVGYQQTGSEMKMNQVAYNQNYYTSQGISNQNAYNGTYNTGAYPRQEGGAAKGFSITAMVCGIVALCCSCCFYYISFPTAIVAVVFAYLSIKKQAAAGANRGMAIAGMVCGIVALIPAMIVLLCGASLLDEI